MKKRVWALILCLALCLALLPAASAAGATGLAANQFPSFGSAMGYYLKGSEDETVAQYEDKSKNPASFDELLEFAQEYVDLLVDTCPFQVVCTFDKHYYGGTKTCILRYTGTAEMKENLEFGDYLDWFHYSPYHLKVAVTEYNNNCWMTVAWDEGLEAVETELRTPSGERLGRERPMQTVVLGINYNKMTVDDEVVQVDSGNASVCPVALNNRTLVPIRPIVEAFGGEVSWSSKTNNTTYTLGDRTVSHVIGSRDVTIQADGKTQKKTMEVPSFAMNDRTYVPVRYVLEGLGLWVGYEPTYGLVVVSTENLTGEDLVKLSESQRLFRSEPVPEIPTRIVESYTLDGGTYTMEVGEALTLFNARQAISTYSAYTWEVVDGGELVALDPNGPTCRFYAKRPGVVTVHAYLDQTIQGSTLPSDYFNHTSTMTITITPATGSSGGSSLMTWQPCPACKGVGTIRSGTKDITCTTCLGRKQLLLP